ncbi:hypothetical protein EUTSA_v10002184mg [Eutrema salsugineum]|uniref:SWIM-type domain-containing protein n=1 Tax=Eutrema salsugineum TaxID=72664 RepID=V4MCB3_EUTSA|nr:hypothetical protein EUTSA_v10002184mg [Eutrema salsugineum]
MTGIVVQHFQISYLPSDLTDKSGFSPVIITNDRQVKNFVGYAKKNLSKENIHSESRCWLVDAVKKGQVFKTKNYSKVTLEICAMKHNFDYDVKQSTKKFWSIRCKDRVCNWSVRAEYLEDSTYFKINKGFYRAMRRVIVVDDTFLKRKYKGVLLVATALDGLYPIAFLVIADGQGVAFVSDINLSVTKALAKVYPHSSHGICIHHLLSNVASHFKTKGLDVLIAKASKEYRVAEFERRFNNIRNISPLVAKYLMEAGVEKWARCRFSRFRYDIQTTNLAESLNSVLLAPKEFPVIPLLDIITEMRIEKGKSVRVHPVSLKQFLVRGDKFDCLVDLELRTCTCGKYTLLKIPCRHSIKAGFSVNTKPHTLTDAMFTITILISFSNIRFFFLYLENTLHSRYTTAVWRIAYEKSINPIGVPEDTWVVPMDIENSKVLAPETRRAAGRRRKRRYETRTKKHKCSRCGLEGHKRGTCDMSI